MGEPSPPLSPARNETSLSFGSNPSNEEIEEEDEEDNDDFNLNLSGLTLNDTACRQYLSSLCPERSKKMCLEVPNMAGADSDGVGNGKQMRSASFDEIRSRELFAGASQGGKGAASNLNVPDIRNVRSRSFDYAATAKSTSSITATTPGTSSSPAKAARKQYRGTRNDSTASNASSAFLDVPKWKMLIRRPSSGSQSSVTDSTVKFDCIHCILLDNLNHIQNLTPPVSDFETNSECSSYNEDDERDVPMLTVDDDDDSKAEANEAGDEFMSCDFPIEPREGVPIVTFTFQPPDSPTGIENLEEDTGGGITVVSLEVPVLSGSKQARSASVDSPYLLQVPKRTDIEVLEGPPKARSKSVDIVLPQTIDGAYSIRTQRSPPIATTK